MTASSDRPRILLVYRSYSSFVRNDHDLLRGPFEVVPFAWRGKSDLLRLRREIRASDLVLVWFAMDHAAVATFFAQAAHVPIAIVAGGVDVQAAPEIGYGRFADSRFRQALTRYALTRADVVLAVSRSTYLDVQLRAKPRRLELVPNGIDPQRFAPPDGDPDQAREDLVITIGSATPADIPLKGLDTFARVAARFPEHRFVIIGPFDEQAAEGLRALAPNVGLSGPVRHELVRDALRRARVYCQLSFLESFGVGTAEAMATGCIPVVSDRGNLPDLVGDVGRIAPYGDVDAVAQAIRAALADSADPAKRAAARRRILDHYTLDRRGHHLRRLMWELLESGPTEAHHHQP